jgi:hypothetical protein
MPNYSISITPVDAFAQKANHVVIQPGSFGPPPTFIATIGVLVAGRPAIAAVGTPGHAGYVPEVPEVPGQFSPQAQREIQLTQAEWDAWDTRLSDEDYIRNLVAAKLGFTISR